MKKHELETIQLLRKAAEIARSVSNKLDSCYEAHCKATAQKQAA